MIRNIYKRLLLLCMAWMLIFSFACRTKTEEAGQMIFHYNQGGGVSNLDPAFARNQANMWAVHQLYNGLVQFDEQLNIQPCLANSFEISTDGLLYTFHLRQDVLFCNDSCFNAGRGRRLLASDVEFSLQRIIDPVVASPGAWIFQDKVAGPEAFRAVDDSTFTISLLSPFRPLPGILTMEYCSIIPHEAVEFYGNNFRKNPVGSGPFQLSRWDEGNVLVLTKNPGYYMQDSTGQRLPYIDKILVSFIDNKSTEFLSFLNGDLDFVSDIDPGLKELVLTPEGLLQAHFSDRFRLLKGPYLNTEYLGFMLDSAHCKPGSPVLSRKFRQAVNCGFDRKKMLQYLRNNKGIAATRGMIPPGLLPVAHPGYGYTYDRDKASLLLKESGLSMGDMSPIELSAPPGYADLCEFIQKQLEEIGIPITLRIVQPSALRSGMEQNELSFFRASWIADYPDAESYMALFYSPFGSPPNYTRYQNPAFDALYQQVVAENNDSISRKLYRAMDSLVMLDAPVVPLYYDEVYLFVSRRVSGLRVNPMNMLDLEKVQVGVGE